MFANHPVICIAIRAKPPSLPIPKTSATLRALSASCPRKLSVTERGPRQGDCHPKGFRGIGEPKSYQDGTVEVCGLGGSSADSDTNKVWWSGLKAQ